MVRRALITGITGQGGSYLAEFLLARGYEVHGVVRRASTKNFDRISSLAGQMSLHQADLLDQLSDYRSFPRLPPGENYNLAAMTFVNYLRSRVPSLPRAGPCA